MTRILVFEKIFKYLRDVLKKREDLYVIGTFHSIITCPWCAGVWVTLIIVVFYFLVPYGYLTGVCAGAGRPGFHGDTDFEPAAYAYRGKAADSPAGEG